MARNVKVTLDDLPKGVRNNSKDLIRDLYRVFDGQVKKSGILLEYKQKETFESRGEKRRRKEREAARERFKKQNKNKQGN